MSTITPSPVQAFGSTIPGEVRLSLYETMVLSRTYEEAILREYHADKGPGFDIGKGLVPGECTCRPARSRSLRACARTSPAPTPSRRLTVPTTSRSRTEWTCER